MTTIRILHVLDTSLPLHSGYGFRTLSIIKAQRDLGWQTFHLTGPKHEGPRQPEETVEGWKYYRTPKPRGILTAFPVGRALSVMRATARRLREVIGEVRPDILHVHSPGMTAIPVLAVGRQRNIPVVYEVRAFWEDAAVDHGTYKAGSWRYRATRLFDTIVLKRADATTTICEELRKEIVGRGIAPDRITVIPNAVDPEQFTATGDPDPGLARRLGIEGADVLGFIGSFFSYEGLDLLLEVLPRVKAALPSVKIVLVGGGREEGRLKGVVHGLGLADDVVFAGRVPHGQVGRYYDLAHLMVYPRRSTRLTELVTPLKPLEAMAQECVCLASDVGGHRELIEDGETGYLFKAGDADDLTRRILEVFRHRDQWPRIRAAGRKLIEEERNWRLSVSRYRRVYGDALKSRQAAGHTARVRF